MDSHQPDDLRTRVPFRTVLASIAGLWLCYFVLATLRWEMLDLGFGQEMLWRRALATLSGMMITLALWLILRLFEGKRLWATISAAALLSLPAAVAIAHTNQLFMRDIEARVTERIAEENGLDIRSQGTDLFGEVPDAVPKRAVFTSAWGDLTDLAFGRYFMMLAWCALYLALLTGEKARAAERREGAYKRAAKAAELRSLRYQVNPHFLFNTLNSLSALVLTGKTQAAERMIQQISTFYRRSLADDPTADVPLSEEFALQKLYLDIEGVRFPRRLRAEYDLPAELTDVRVPGMILQPLVENSVRHAIAPSSGRVTITLAAREEYGRLVVTVSDDGHGRQEGASRRGHGIGLGNVRERIEARFGAEATIVSGPTAEGYSTQLRLPILRQGEERNE